MYKIALIVPYFGKLPDNFQIWLNSCAYNPDVNCLIFTDDRTSYEYPSNVQVVLADFSSLKSRIQKLYDFQISLDSAYKLCDYKVAYGEIFTEELHGFDFWGFCDVDLIFGRIRNFITDDILSCSDKILSRGHFTLFRNTPEINQIYRSAVKDRLIYKEVFSDPQSRFFDEWSPNGINQLFIASQARFYDPIIFSDIYIARYGFYPYQLMIQKKEMHNSIYLWDQGVLTRFYVVRDELKSYEDLYAHFQKRHLTIPDSARQAKRLLIFPNQYLPYDGAVDLFYLK